MIERHVSTVEIRQEGRRLIGPALTYGDVSPTHRERFEVGAFRDVDDGNTRTLNLDHRAMEAVAWMPGGGLELRDTDSALELVATIPETPAGNVALRDVQTGRRRGLSVEFNAIRERRESEIRVIQVAELGNIGLVRSPSYKMSTVEIRQTGLELAASIPADTDLACECSGQDCTHARFARSTLGRMWADAQTERGGNVIGFYGDYKTPVASLSKGTLRGSLTDDGLDVVMDIPEGDVGAQLMGASEVAGLITRPFLDSRQSEGDRVERGGNNVLVYTLAKLRALIISPTDARENWPESVIRDTTRSERVETPRRARRRRWL